MARNLKGLGVCLVTLLAMIATAASASMASTPRVTSAGYPALVAGEQVTSAANDFTLEGSRKVTCEKAKYTAEYTKAQSEAATWGGEFTPEFVGCTAVILGNVTPATITVNGCKLSMGSESTVSTTEQNGAMNVSCPGEAKMEIHIWQTSAKHLANETALCTFSVGHQASNLPGITTKLISSTELELVGNVTGLAVSRTGGTLTNCGAASQSGGLKSTIRSIATKGGVKQTLSMDKE